MALLPFAAPESRHNGAANSKNFPGFGQGPGAPKAALQPAPERGTVAASNEQSNALLVIKSALHCARRDRC